MIKQVKNEKIQQNTLFLETAESPYIDKARQEKKALVETLYKKIQLCKHQCDTYYLCIIFKNSGPHYVIATGQPTKTYPSLTLFAITLENPHFYYTKEKCEKLFTDKLNQLN